MEFASAEALEKALALDQKDYLGSPLMVRRASEHSKGSGKAFKGKKELLEEEDKVSVVVKGWPTDSVNEHALRTVSHTLRSM